MESETKSNLLAVSVIVLNEAGNILLRKRAKAPDEGKWELFAGYPFLHERPLEKAVRRILSSKAGIEEVSAITFSGKYYDDPNRHPGVACIPLVFIATVSGVIEGADDKKWFSPSEIKDLPMALDNKKVLLDLGFLS